MGTAVIKKTLLIVFAFVPTGFLIASILLVFITRSGRIVYTPLMWERSIVHAGDSLFHHQCYWVPLEQISEEMVRAVIAAEDGRFFSHQGFDYEEMAKMKTEHLFDGSPIRGCSTISQQTAKNCFTFCSRTWVRKGIEAYYTVLIEKIWGKRRILEVYLNVAEMGPGIYGAEAAARNYYHIHASDLTLSDASSLACCLPNPRHRNPEWANRQMASRRAQIARLARQVAGLKKLEKKL